MIERSNASVPHNWWSWDEVERRSGASWGRTHRVPAVLGGGREQAWRDRSGDLVAAAVEDESERAVVEDGVVGRTVAGEHQTGIFSEGGIPEAVVQVLDGPVPASERQQPLCVRLLGGQRGDAEATSLESTPVVSVAVADDAKHLLDLRVVEHA